MGSTGRSPRPAAAMCGVLSVLLAACASGVSPATVPSAGSSSPTPAGATSAAPGTPPPGETAAPSTAASQGALGAPATVTMSFGGDPHLAGGTKLVFIKCGYPTVAGRNITVFGQASDGMDGFALTATAGKLDILVSTGKGPTYVARQFEGTAVVGFDALKGFSFDSVLTEVPLKVTPAGSIPTLKSMRITVDCAGDTTGGSTLHVTGSIPEGAIDADVDDVRVECDTGMGVETVITQGILTIGSTKTFITASVNDKGNSTLFLGTTTVHFLSSDPGVGGRVEGLTGSYTGDVIAQPSNNIPKLTLTLSGMTTCGSAVTF